MKTPLNVLDTSTPPRHIIWALAWPTILEQILQVTVTYVDSAMVGSLGTEPDVRPLAFDYMNYIALGYIPNLLMITISSLFRCSGDAKTPLYLNGFNNLANIFLNLLFIFPSLTLGPLTIPALGLGVKRAAMATTLSCSITALLLLHALFRGNNAIRISPRGNWKYDRQIQRQAMRLGLPVALERSTLSFGQIFFTKMVGTLGTTELATHHLANTAESITYLPPSGFSTAATTLVAQSLGNEHTEQAKRYANSFIILGTLLMSFMGVVLYVFAPQLMGFFTKDEQVLRRGTKVLRIEALQNLPLAFPCWYLVS